MDIKNSVHSNTLHWGTLKTFIFSNWARNPVLRSVSFLISKFRKLSGAISLIQIFSSLFSKIGILTESKALVRPKKIPKQARPLSECSTISFDSKLHAYLVDLFLRKLNWLSAKSFSKYFTNRLFTTFYRILEYTENNEIAGLWEMWSGMGMGLWGFEIRVYY